MTCESSQKPSIHQSDRAAKMPPLKDQTSSTSFTFKYKFTESIALFFKRTINFQTLKVQEESGVTPKFAYCPVWAQIFILNSLIAMMSACLVSIKQMAPLLASESAKIKTLYHRECICVRAVGLSYKWAL